MTKHEEEVRKLAATPLGGQRFDLFIRRWEMNNEPLPTEEPKSDKHVTTILALIIVLTSPTDLLTLEVGRARVVTPLMRKKKITSIPTMTKKRFPYRSWSHGREAPGFRLLYP